MKACTPLSIAGVITVAAIGIVAFLSRSGPRSGVSLLDIDPCASSSAPAIIDGGAAGSAEAQRPDQELAVLSVTENFRLGAADSGIDRRGGAQHLTLNSQGSVVVYDAIMEQLLMFDAAGVEQWSVDGAGFEYVSEVGIVADTIVLLTRSGGSHGFRLFGLDSVPITVTAEPGVQLERFSDAGCSVATFAGTAGNGLVLFTPSAEGMARTAPVVHMTYELRTFSPGAGIGGVVWSWTDPIPTHMIDVSYSAEGGGPVVIRLSIRPPWSPMARLALFDDGFYFSPDGGLEIEKYDARGQRTGIFVLPGDPDPVGEVDLESYYGELLAGGEDAAHRKAVRDSILAVAARLRPAETLPVISGMWASPDGTLAVMRSDVETREIAGAAHVAVDLMTSSGEVRGRIWLPERISIKAFGGAFLYGSEPAGTSGDTFLVRYRIGN